ncbi:DUF6781 family protein [Ideonella livida]|uniref:DUF6781 family protein n=1 Tax=Ideonella livida TaxID=2707176 RepID=UPI0019402EB2|nr:DUF6781 family protein [Ideonella livida]
MFKAGIDQDALIEQFAQSSARHSQALRQQVTEVTLKALQGREMTLKNIKGVVKSVTEAASAGAARNPAPAADVEQMLATAVAGVDDALLKAVEANRVALERFVEHGVNLGEKQMQNALEELDKFDTLLLGVVRKAAGAEHPAASAWQPVLDQMKLAGTASGQQAAATVVQVTEQMQAAMKQGRQAGLKAAQSLAGSYHALVSGVLMGLSDAMRQVPPPAPEPAPAPRRAPARKRS